MNAGDPTAHWAQVPRPVLAFWLCPHRPHLIVGEPSRGEDGDFLTTGNAVHDINGRNTRLNHLLRVDSVMGVDGLTWERQSWSHAQGFPFSSPPQPQPRLQSSAVPTYWGDGGCFAQCSPSHIKHGLGVKMSLI